MDKRHGNILVIFLGALLVISLAAVGFYYWGHRQTVNQSPITNTANRFPMTNVAADSLSLVIKPDGIYTSAGTRLVDKNLPIFREKSIATIEGVVMSPDKLAFCFVGLPDVPFPTLFVANINGGDIKVVGNGTNCTWSPKSTKIAFTNRPSDVSPIDVYVYLVSGVEPAKNLTSNTTQSPTMRFYNSLNWLDDINLTAKYSQFDTPEETNNKSGISQINTVTGAVTDQ